MTFPSSSSPGFHRRYHSELRLFIASTSRDIGPERSLLGGPVLQELRERASERGVIVVDCDPRWEIALEPARASEIFAARMSELNGYRPIFIGIIGKDGFGSKSAQEGALPWLRDMGAGNDPGVAADFIEGVLDNQLMRERAFFYIMEGDGRDSSERIARLRERLAQSGFPIRDGIADREELGRSILNDLLATLDRLHPSYETISFLEQLRRSQRAFASRLLRAYEEIPHYFDTLDRHLTGGKAPLLVTGRSGDGKSALIANWMNHARRVHPDLPIICHHVQSASEPSDHAMVLRHLLAELKERFAITAPLPQTRADLASAFPVWLAQIGAERLVIVIDGADQLDERSQSLDWLPWGADIPHNIRLVVCAADDGAAGELIAERLRERGCEELHVEPLTIRQQRSVISMLMPELGGDLELLKRFSLGGDISSPLFIRMGAGQIRNSGSERERNELLNELLDAGTGEEFLERMFRQLEERFGMELIGDILRLVWGARRGLLASELLALTKTDADEVERLLDSAGSYLVEHDGLWSFPHKRVREAVERRYLREATRRRAVHRRLAGYFSAQPASLRRADEEPWQWERAGNRRMLARSLADIANFMRLSVEDRRHELREYWVRLDDEELMMSAYRRSFQEWSDAHAQEERAVVAERLGLFLMASGLLTPAEEYLSEARDLFAAASGAEHPDTARAMHDLAELMRRRGEYARAEEIFQEALAIMERVLPADDPTIAQTLSDIALLHRDAGQYRSALPFYQRALDLTERIHGADHPATAEVLNDLALFYQDLHELDKAIPLYRRALDIRERRFGSEHPAIATIRNNMAGALRDAGDLDQAESNYRRALEIRERMLGAGHPNTLITVANLASLLRKRKKFQESHALFTRAISGTIANLGAEHPNVMSLNISFAFLLSDSGDTAAAEKLLRQTLTTAHRTLGETHPLVGTCANNLATLLRAQGRLDEAAPLYERALAACRVSLGAEHPNIGRTLHNLGAIRLTRGETAAAATLLEEALAIGEKHFPADHWMVFETRELLAKARAA